MSALTDHRTRPRPRAPGTPLRVVRPPGRRHTLPFALLLLVLGAAAVFAAVSLSALAAGDAVRARELEQAVADQERLYGQLVADVAGLEEPGRIRRFAVDELGMVEPGSVRVLHLDRPLEGDARGGEAVGTAGPADPLKPILTKER